MIRSYYIVCPSCAGKGYIPDSGLSTSTTITCPACSGSGKVMVTEQINDNSLYEISDIIWTDTGHCKEGGKG